MKNFFLTLSDEIINDGGTEHLQMIANGFLTVLDVSLFIIGALGALAIVSLIIAAVLTLMEKLKC